MPLDFVRNALGKNELYRVEDPLLNVVATALKNGDGQHWHFGQSEFAVTLLLQKAETGGASCYAPDIRSDFDENYTAVAQVIDGDASRVREARVEPGTLVLFRGNKSLHRVSRVSGKGLRIILIFRCHDTPGFKWSEQTHVSLVGRSAQPYITA